MGALCLVTNGLPAAETRDYAQDMRDFVQGISAYAKKARAGFLVVPQNGAPLVTEDLEPGGTPAAAYLAAIDGQGQEDLNFGYDSDDKATKAGDRAQITPFLDIERQTGKTVLVIDYCHTPKKMDAALAANAKAGYIGLAQPDRELRAVPGYPKPPPGENAERIAKLGEVRNFLYLINPGEFGGKAEFIAAVQGTNHDLAVVDLYFDGKALTKEDVAALRKKANGGSRLVLCYMSIGEAEDYRPYWSKDWNLKFAGAAPAYITEQNPDWPGNYKVKYWDPRWQEVIFGREWSYLDKIIESGFDGAYLDIVDAYEYFQAKAER